MTKKQTATIAGSLAVAAAVVVGVKQTNTAVDALPVLPMPKPDLVLRWDHSDTPEVSGYEVYRSQNVNSGLWALDQTVGYTNVALFTNTILPVWFAVVTVLSNGEKSLMSETIGVLGKDSIVTVWSEETTNVFDGNWMYVAPVITKTNPSDVQRYYRLGISNEIKLRLEH